MGPKGGPMGFKEGPKERVQWGPLVFHSFSLFYIFFHGFFKELDFKELEIHGYSLMDTINEYQWISINEYQWISINEYQWISINEFIDGISMNMVPFLWALSFGPHGAAFWPHEYSCGSRKKRARRAI